MGLYCIVCWQKKSLWVKLLSTNTEKPLGVRSSDCTLTHNAIPQQAVLHLTLHVAPFSRIKTHVGRLKQVLAQMHADKPCALVPPLCNKPGACSNSFTERLSITTMHRLALRKRQHSQKRSVFLKLLTSEFSDRDSTPTALRDRL